VAAVGREEQLQRHRVSPPLAPEARPDQPPHEAVGGLLRQHDLEALRLEEPLGQPRVGGEAGAVDALESYEDHAATAQPPIKGAR